MNIVCKLKFDRPHNMVGNGYETMAITWLTGQLDLSGATPKAIEIEDRETVTATVERDRYPMIGEESMNDMETEEQRLIDEICESAPDLDLVGRKTLSFEPDEE